jgi:hypothetical protein
MEGRLPSRLNPVGTNELEHEMSLLRVQPSFFYDMECEQIFVVKVLLFTL